MRYIWQRSDWPNFKWQSDQLLDVLGEARFHQGKLLSKISALGMNLSQEAQAEILIEETLKTAAIEGQILDRKSVRSSVAKRLGLPAGGLPAAGRHVDGLVDVLLDATSHYDQSLTPKRLKSWQAALFPTGYSGLRRIRTGKWRGTDPVQVVSGPIGREKIHFEAPPSDKVDLEIRKFISWWEKGSIQMEGLLRAGVAHFRFITIHPFEDGNGRIARALTDMALAQDEKLSQRFYSLSSRIMREREDYYNVLERSQKGDVDITRWLRWFLGCYRRAVEDSQNLISKILAKAEFWQRHGQTTLNDRQRKVINKLLDAGPGGFEGGLTTRKYVSMAKVSRTTGFREISDLVKKRFLLKNEARGRSVSYDIRWKE
ncbi:Fic domain protein, PA0574 type [Olavius sp. associated proteobacterium Delta 1]|nr:Fic domain protein, PA0574 type [Olavius sp. associated proteobacterium Delta 1]